MPERERIRDASPKRHEQHRSKHRRSGTDLERLWTDIDRNSRPCLGKGAVLRRGDQLYGVPGGRWAWLRQMQKHAARAAGGEKP